MLVQDWEDDVIEGEVLVASSALTCGTVHDADRQHKLIGAEWPVSGDATTRAGTIIHRKNPAPFF